jgi:carbonic anhydrase/acetyltransferase-like protein (isoleucine patch superfamily)
MPVLLPYGDKTPSIAPGVFVAATAAIIGDVEIGTGSSVWFGCVLRGDVNFIRIGEDTNIQDGTVVHVRTRGDPAIIGNGVTIGHSAVLHACTLQDASFVGMQAVVLDGCRIETDAMLAAGALLAPGTRVGKGELWAGRPAKCVRALNADEIAYIKETALNYRRLGAEYAARAALTEAFPPLRPGPLPGGG